MIGATRMEARYLRARGQDAELAQTLLQLLPCQGAQFGTNDLDYLCNLFDLASIDSDQLNYTEAGSLLVHVVASGKAVFGNYYPRYLNTSVGFAKLDIRQGKYNEAGCL